MNTGDNNGIDDNEEHDGDDDCDENGQTKTND